MDDKTPKQVKRPTISITTAINIPKINIPTEINSSPWLITPEIERRRRERRKQQLEQFS